jgi:hypothetical protein
MRVAPVATHSGEVTPTEEAQMSSSTARSTALAVAGAAVLAAATLWTVLIDARVSVSAPPEWVPGTDFGAYLEDYYAWEATTLAQERWCLALLATGLLTVIVTAVRRVATSTSTDGLRTRRVVAAGGVATGALLWVLVSLAAAGGRHAIELMAASGNQIDAVNSIAFTIATTTSWMHAGGCLILGLGMLGLAAEPGAGVVRVIAVATGVTALVFAGLLVGAGEWAKYAGLVLGGLLLPAWILVSWLGSADRREPTTVDLGAEPTTPSDGPGKRTSVLQRNPRPMGTFPVSSHP